MCKLCRASLTIRFVEQLNVTRFFEVGAGTGDIMISLAQRCLQGRGIDLSEQAVLTCQQRIRAEGLAERLDVRRGDLLTLSNEAEYDLVIAFEVLEHIEDDFAALEALRNLVRPRGYLLLSVPAHARKWGAHDEWAGHLRRYERNELQEKLRASRFAVREFLSYGYPLHNLTRHLRNLVYARHLRREESKRERTLRSSFARPRSLRLLLPQPNVLRWLVPQLQRPFLHSDLGEGYFVVAQRED